MLARRNDSDHEQLNTMLRGLIGQLDGVIMFRPRLPSSKSGNFIGVPRRKLSHIDLQPIFWSTNDLKIGRFIYYKSDKDEEAELAVCISKLNPISKRIVILTRERIKTEYSHEISQNDYDITDITNSKDLLLPWTDYKTIGWDESLIEKGRVLIKKEHGRTPVPVLCTAVTGVHAKKKKYAYYQYNPIEIDATKEFIAVIVSECNKTLIPMGLCYDTPITYFDHSPAANTTLHRTPSTFVAMYQYEAIKGTKLTSIKRYFCNVREGYLFEKKRSWKLFCGRMWSFTDDDEPSHDGEGIEKESIASIDESESPLQSVVFESNDARRFFQDDIIPEDSSVKGKAGSFNKMSANTMNLYRASSSQVFINIFIILHHWARHDAHKVGADKALWEPDPDETGFDVFYPAHQEETYLKPWMFTITQALRDWISTLVARNGAIHWQEISAGRGIDGMIYAIVREKIDKLKEIIGDELNEICNIFNTEFNPFKNILRGKDMSGKINPVTSALDRSDLVDKISKLEIRGCNILKQSFEKAFPDVNTGSKHGSLGIIDFKENGQINIDKESFLNYITVMMVGSKLSGIYFDLDTKVEVDKIPDSLQSISIRQAVGTHFEKGSPGYEMMKSIPMTPLLFPQYLAVGDILYINEPHGSTIVRVYNFYDGRYATEIEMENSRPGIFGDLKHEDVYDRRRYKQFQPVMQAIEYDLEMDPIEGYHIDNTYFIQDFSNVFIIHKQTPHS